MVLVTSTAFAWTQPICNSSTGQVLQPSQFPNETAYNQYISSHPGSFEMSAGQTCHSTAPQVTTPAVPLVTTQALTSPAPSVSSSPSGAHGSSTTAVCLVTVSPNGTLTEERHVSNVTEWLAQHPGSHVMSAGGNCGPSFVPAQTPTHANFAPVSLAASALNLPVASAPEQAVSPEQATTPEQAASPEQAAAPEQAMSPEASTPEQATAPEEAVSAEEATAAPEVAGVQVQAQAVSAPPNAGDGSTADEIVP